MTELHRAARSIQVALIKQNKRLTPIIEDDGSIGAYDWDYNVTYDCLELARVVIRDTMKDL